MRPIETVGTNDKLCSLVDDAICDERTGQKQTMQMFYLFHWH